MRLSVCLVSNDINTRYEVARQVTCRKKGYREKEDEVSKKKRETVRERERERERDYIYIIM